MIWLFELAILSKTAETYSLTKTKKENHANALISNNLFIKHVTFKLATIEELIEKNNWKTSSKQSKHLIKKINQ